MPKIFNKYEEQERISALILKTDKREIEKEALELGYENTSHYIREILHTRPNRIKKGTRKPS